MKLTQNVPFLIHNFLSISVFFAPPFFFLQLDHGVFEYLTKEGTLRSTDFAQFSSVAHERTFQCAYHSFRATAHLGATLKKTELFSSAPAPFAFSSQVDAKVAAQCISFFPFFSRSPDSYAKVL